MLAITIDTNLLLDWRSRILGMETNALADARGARVEQMMWSSILGAVFVWASSRVLYADVDAEDREQLRSLMLTAGIRIGGSSFRIGVSPIGGPDALGGRAATRSTSEIDLFRAIAGADPAGRRGTRMSNKIADYDSLFDHFCARQGPKTFRAFCPFSGDGRGGRRNSPVHNW